MAPLPSMMEAVISDDVNGTWTVVNCVVIVVVLAVNLVATWLLCANCCGGGNNAKDQVANDNITHFEEPPPDPWQPPADSGQTTEGKKKQKKRTSKTDKATRLSEASPARVFDMETEGGVSRSSTSDKSFLLMEEFKIYPKPKPEPHPEEENLESSGSMNKSFQSPTQNVSLKSKSILSVYTSPPKKRRSRNKGRQSQMEENDQ